MHNEDYLFGGYDRNLPPDASKTLELTFYREIIDDHYPHALRLFRDKGSGGVRLEASALRGELKKYAN